VWVDSIATRRIGPDPRSVETTRDTSVGTTCPDRQVFRAHHERVMVTVRTIASRDLSHELVGGVRPVDSSDEFAAMPDAGVARYARPVSTDPGRRSGTPSG